MTFARFLVAMALACATVLTSSAQENATIASHRKTLDQILDLYVRDGFVYYRALRAERAKLDAYVASLSDASLDALPREERLAFWLNAYNALVLKTVVDHYPVPKRSAQYPDHSIRQIPGAFERLPHRVARQMLTLDEIETKMLPEFKDPRVYFALGRGAVGSGRLRSEAYAPALLEMQLGEVAAECATQHPCIEVDRTNNVVNASSVFSWRSAEFVSAYAEKAPAVFAPRSPVERAILAFVEPNLLTIEKEFLEKNQFKVAFKNFDWTLNDLTGRGGR